MLVSNFHINLTNGVMKIKIFLMIGTISTFADIRMNFTDNAKMSKILSEGNLYLCVISVCSL